MRDYSKVGPKFWIGKTGKALRKQGVETLVVSMYLMTAPSANMLGLYYLPVVTIAHETGLGLEGASKGLARAIEVGFCAYDHDAEMVWVYEMAAYQVAERLEARDNRCAGVQRDYDDLPENQHLRGFYEKYATAFHMKSMRDFGSPSEAPCKPLRSQEQEQEQEQDKNNTSANPAAVTPPVQNPDLDPPPGRPERRKSPRYTEPDQTCAQWLYDRIRANNPEHKPPSMATWADEVRLMRERDGRGHREICELFGWAQDDSFWRANILSPAKLREKWDQLTMQRARPKVAGAGAWWLTDETMNAKAAEYGLTANRGEGRDQFKARIQAAIDKPKRPPAEPDPATAPSVPSPPPAPAPAVRSLKPEGLDLKSLIRPVPPMRSA